MISSLYVIIVIAILPISSTANDELRGPGPLPWDAMLPLQIMLKFIRH